MTISSEKCEDFQDRVLEVIGGKRIYEGKVLELERLITNAAEAYWVSSTLMDRLGEEIRIFSVYPSESKIFLLKLFELYSKWLRRLISKEVYDLSYVEYFRVEKFCEHLDSFVSLFDVGELQRLSQIEMLEKKYREEVRRAKYVEDRDEKRISEVIRELTSGYFDEFLERKKVADDRYLAVEVQDTYEYILSLYSEADRDGNNNLFLRKCLDYSLQELFKATTFYMMYLKGIPRYLKLCENSKACMLEGLSAFQQEIDGSTEEEIS